MSPLHTADERETADIAGLVGYALGDDGMLFRGELLDTCTAEEARAAALASADYWAERDAAEEAESEVEIRRTSAKALERRIQILEQGEALCFNTVRGTWNCRGLIDIVARVPGG